jgi:glycosyltransferase involved in cell wall biosynthesis
MRGMNLSNYLVDKGHEVVFWSSDFYHQEKIHRFSGLTETVISSKLRLILIPSRGYKRNIGFGRLLDHFELAVRLFFLLNKSGIKPPEVAFVGYPPIECALVMVLWLKQKKIPVMLDIKDQWPTIFLELLPKYFRWIGKIIFSPYFFAARLCMNSVDAFCTMTPEFLDWIYEFSTKKPSPHDAVTPLTAPTYMISKHEENNALMWWRALGVNDLVQQNIVFSGSLTRAFDFSIVKELALICKAKNMSCTFIICGDGPLKSQIKNMMNGVENVIISGWVDAIKLQTLLKRSLATISPYVTNDAFNRSIPNKIIDSLRSGLPVITTLEGVTKKIILDEGIGISTHSLEEMALFIKDLIYNVNIFESISARSRELYRVRFDPEIAYGSLVQSLEGLACVKK